VAGTLTLSPGHLSSASSKKLPTPAKAWFLLPETQPHRPLQTDLHLTALCLSSFVLVVCRTSYLIPYRDFFQCLCWLSVCAPAQCSELCRVLTLSYHCLRVITVCSAMCDLRVNISNQDGNKKNLCCQGLRLSVASVVLGEVTSIN
jgi:hypothetical protein